MEKKRVIGFVFIGLVLMSLFVGVVSAQNEETGMGSVNKFFKDNFGVDFSYTWETEFFKAGGGFQKFLIFALVSLIIYSISSFLPFLENNPWINAGVAVIVGILSAFWLSSEEIATALLSYRALGIILTGIIPFFAIAVISKKSFDKGHPFMGKVLWIGFFVVTLIRWLSATDIGAFGKIVYPIVLIVTLIMFFVQNWIYIKLAMAGRALGITVYTEGVKNIISVKIKELEEKLGTAGLSEDEKETILDRIKSLKEQQKAL